MQPWPAEAKNRASPSSPPKKQKTEDDEDMAEFEAKLVDLDVSLADVDPELQTKLKSSKSSRKDFLAIHINKPFLQPR